MLDLVMFLANDAGFCEKTKDIWRLVGTVVFWIQIAIPVIIILLGTIDLGKAVISSDDKKIKESQSMFIRRLIYGVAVFFVVFVVRIIFAAVGDAVTDTDGSGPKTCFKCVSGRGTC